jgi:phosphoglycerate kinase
MLKKLTIDKLGKRLADKRILMRVDFNVPIKNGKINDETKIKESLNTIKYTLDNGAKSVILLSHLGRPDGQRTEKDTLAPIAPVLANHLKREVQFLEDCIGANILEVNLFLNLAC